MRRSSALISTICAPALVLGCADDDDAELQVFAAASLHSVLAEIAEIYTEETGTEVQINAAGSSTLVEQASHGAAADVLATADETTMEQAVESGLTSGDPEVFAANHLVLITPPGNPAEVQGLSDLQDSAVDTVVCAPQVPCGAATARLADSAEVGIQAVSEETSVTDVLGRVRSQEADAGLVYATDALQAVGEVETLELPGAAEDPNYYPVALLEGAASAEAGMEFIEFLLTDEQAQQILQEAGFTEVDR